MPFTPVATPDTAGPLIGRRTLFGAAGCAALPRANPACAGGRSFFVSPDGDDAADGLTESSPLRSIAAVNALRLQPGDQVLLRRGGIWQGGLVPPGSGAPGRPIRFAAYGKGPRPLLTGAVRVEGLVMPHGRSGPWQTALKRQPTQVFIDGERGVRVTRLRDVAQPGHWYWDNGVLTVAGSPRPQQPEIQASLTDFVLDGRERSHLLFEDLQIGKAAWHGVFADTLAYATIRRCRIFDAYGNGFQGSSREPHDAVIIEDSEIAGCGGSGINIGGHLSDWVIRRNHIHHCCLLHEGVPGPRERTAQFEWSAGIKAWGWGSPGFQGACTVEGNIITDLGAPRPTMRGIEAHKRGIGLWWDEVIAPAQRQALRRNTILRCQSRGILIEKSDAVDVDYNLIVDCAVVEYSGALALQANSAGYDVVRDKPGYFPRDARWNRLRHNTVIGRGWVLEVIAQDEGCRLEQNEVSGNILIGELHIVGGGANDGTGGSGNSFRRNCLGPEGPRWRWGQHVHRSYATLEAASAGSFAVSVPGDPQFVAPAAGDYRLRPGSPCIDAAERMVQGRDRLGTVVPQGRAADLGCHEFRYDETSPPVPEARGHKAPGG